MLSSCGHWRAQHAPLAALPLPAALHSKACLWLRRPLRQPLSWRPAQQPLSTCMLSAASAAQCQLPAQLRRSSLSGPAQQWPRWSCAGSACPPVFGRGEWRVLRHRRLQHGTVCSYGGDSARQAAGEHGAASSSGASAPEGEVSCCSTGLSGCRSPAAGGKCACLAPQVTQPKCLAGGARAGALGPRQSRAGARPCSVPLPRISCFFTALRKPLPRWLARQVQASGQAHR